MFTEVVSGPTEPRETLLANCTDAARYVVLSREQAGYDTPYDHFLCDYIGDTTAPLFRPISVNTPHGISYSYNNGLTMHRSYTREGSMLNIRHVEGELADRDENYEYFVATTDLEMGETVAWRVLQTEKEIMYGRSTIILSLARQPRAELVEPGGYVSEGRKRVEALVMLDSQRGVSFLNMAAGRGFEKLHDVAELITEVNELSDRLGIELDRRSQVGQQLAELLLLQRLTA